MKHGHEHGYSLVELLVVLALFGLIAIAISGGIGFGARVWERAQDTVEDSERIRGAQNFLRLLIGHAYPRAADVGDESGETAFSGDATHVSFQAIAPDAIGNGEPARVELTIVPADRGVVLMLKSPNADGRGQELVRSARALAFSFGMAQANGDILWSETWDGKNGVPQLVRLRELPATHAIRIWPELVVHPMIDRDALCIYDAVSFSCRHV